MKKTFILNPAMTHDMAIHALYEKTTQAKAILECLLSAILSDGIESGLLYNAVWAVDEYLDQIIELQDHIESTAMPC
jgi:hypothetical protein